MESSGSIRRTGDTTAHQAMRRHDQVRAPTETTAAFHDRFVALFGAHFPRLYRVLDRLSGEPEMAADLAQEAFVRLYRRGAMPDDPEAWLLTVGLNLFRNAKVSRSRRSRLLTLARGQAAHSDPPRAPDEAVVAAEESWRVRRTIDRLTGRERRLLLLRAEGYSYRDIAAALGMKEASVGVFLARAREAFRRTYEDAFHAP